MSALQVQIAALMQLQGAGADPEQLERMQSMLSQKNSEIEALMTKVRQLEADQVGLILALLLPVGLLTDLIDWMMIE